MKNNGFYKLFMDELKDMLSSELQIIEALPKLIKIASLDDLKEALTNHLEETKNQVTRLKKIFSILGEELEEKTCEGMKGILEEGEEMVKGKTKSSLLDATIISAAQKVEHYEIATYGGLVQLAKTLGYNDAANVLYKTLEEEKQADLLLTQIAERHVNYQASLEPQGA